ncbi:MAG: xanthine dehydrogenase family protein molybdopterin-binding subunit, partial [Acidimicrobiia bacterium]|nr:xanthine dehydrogenase family protein molybdopterin-binding subunit [Acidimicrobiia bacterium]
MSLLGNRVRRTEDPALLTGQGRYVADFAPDNLAHAVFVRSIDPHGIINGIDTEEASALPGVIAVYTAADLDITPSPPSSRLVNQAMLRSSLATERVRFVGEPVAVVLAETHEQGVDAAELVVVDIDPLTAVVNPNDALTDEILLHPEAGTNKAMTIPVEADPDLFADCEVTVGLTFRNHRLSGAPIEPRAALAEWTLEGDRLRLTQWSSTQFPHAARDALAAACGVDKADVRVITPEVGGGFGAKNGSYPEDLVVALAARKLERPVRWVETRTECMLSLAHGRAVEFTATLGGDRDGTLKAYKLHIVQDCGAHPIVGAVLPTLTRMVGTGVYTIPVIEISADSVVTNTVPVGAYRGAGRPEATHAIERMVDLFAAEIAMDPAELRRRNFIKPEDFPFTTPGGMVYDSGRYADALDKVIAAIDI